MVEASAPYQLPIRSTIKSSLAMFSANRRWVVGCVAVFTVLFTCGALFIPPTYRSTAVLLPTESDGSSPASDSALGQISGLASLAGINIGTTGQVAEEALAVLGSKEFTQRFIVDYQLMPILFASDWDASTKTWKKSFWGPPTLGRAFKRFDEKIRTVIPDKKSDLISVQIDWRDRVVAAQWANALVSRLNSEMRARATERSNASIAFLEKEYSSSSEVSTRDAIGRLLDSQIRQRMLAAVTPDFAFRVVDAALPADQDDPVQPRKWVLILLGPLLGFIFAISIIGVGKTFSQ